MSKYISAASLQNQLNALRRVLKALRHEGVVHESEAFYLREILRIHDVRRAPRPRLSEGGRFPSARMYSLRHVFLFSARGTMSPSTLNYTLFFVCLSMGTHKFRLKTNGNHGPNDLITVSNPSPTPFACRRRVRSARSEILLHRELDLFQEHLLERTQIVLLVEEEKRCAVVVRLDRAE